MSAQQGWWIWDFLVKINKIYGGNRMIIGSYDINSEPIVKLENFYGEKQHLVKKCMVIFSKVIYEYMLEKFPCRQIAEVRACNGNIPVWTLPYEEETIAFYLTPIGSALAAGTIAEVDHLTGASVFIMFGSCGSLDKEATDGSLFSQRRHTGEKDCPIILQNRRTT